MFLQLRRKCCFPEDMEFKGAFVQAHEQRCVEAMWGVWCRTAEKFLATKASEATGNDQILIDKRYCGRGFRVEPKRVRAGRARESKNVVRVDPKRRELLKPVDILDEISTLRPMGDMVHISDLLGEAQGLGRNALKPHPFDKHLAQRGIPDPGKNKLTMFGKRVTWGDGDRLLRKWRRERGWSERRKECVISPNTFGHLIKLRPLPDVILPGNSSKIDSMFRRNWLPIFARRDCDDSRFPTR